jgi:hypothetical protein
MPGVSTLGAMCGRSPEWLTERFHQEPGIARAQEHGDTQRICSWDSSARRGSSALGLARIESITQTIADKGERERN